MARPKTEACWEEAIRIATENEPKGGPRLGPLALRSLLEKAATDAGKPDLRVPSLRTIGRIQREWRQRPEGERQPYREFRWPESMEMGALPWEAGPAALELLRWRRAQGERPPRPRYRPLIADARWFWRVTAIAPDAPFNQRYRAANWLASVDMGGIPSPGEKVKRDVELWAALTPWRSEADAKAYQAALADEAQSLTEGGES